MSFDCRWCFSRKAEAEGRATPMAVFSSKTFYDFPRLSGLVPLIGITSGRCYAGNASLLGICDVVIATKGSNIGMGGPAMIEGGGLGIFRPEEIGPLDVQMRNGVVDVAVEDEAAAVERREEVSRVFSGIASPNGVAPISGCCAESFRRIACACMTSAR